MKGMRRRNSGVSSVTVVVSVVVVSSVVGSSHSKDEVVRGGSGSAEDGSKGKNIREV